MGVCGVGANEPSVLGVVEGDVNGDDVVDDGAATATLHARFRESHFQHDGCTALAHGNQARICLSKK